MFIYFTVAILFCFDVYRTLYPLDYNRNKKMLLDSVKPTIVTLSYNAIYCYSYLEIKYNKFKSIVMPITNIICLAITNLLKKHNLILIPSPPPKLVFEIYGKGKNIKNILLHDNFNQLNNVLTDDLKTNNIDFIILSDKSDINNSFTNKIHYYKIPDSLDNISYTISNINFISIELTYNNKVYPIQLKNNIYNHYIVNNKLNSEFYQYYLKNILNIPISSDNINYNFQIIDQNVNIYELSCNQEIVIKENDFEIIDLVNQDKSDQLIEEIEEIEEKEEIEVKESTNDEILEETKLVGDSEYIKI